MFGKHHDDETHHAEAVRVDGPYRQQLVDDTGVGAARRRFGGIDLPASLAGMCAALGLTVLLAGIAAGAGSVGYQRGASRSTLSMSGLVTGLVILLLSFYVGGWVAGRIARYDGMRNGVLTAVWFVLLTAGVSALGAWLGSRYNFFTDVRLPQWFTGTQTTAAVLSAAVGIVVMVLAAALGGSVGSRYHRRADAVVAGDGVVMGDAETDVARSDYLGRHAVR